MKITKVLSLSIIFLNVFTMFSFVVSADENTFDLRQCRSECSIERRADSKQCRDNYNECRDSCSDSRRRCIEGSRNEYGGCREICDGELDRRTRSECIRECSGNYRLEIRECNSRECRDGCKDGKSSCNELMKGDYDMCRDSCEAAGKAANNVASYDFSVDEIACVEAGGFYQLLCKGLYFRSMCSREKYCQCQGFNEYSCPDGYECIVDHDIVVRGRSHMTGWRDLLGNELGEDTGICGIVE